VLVAGPGPPPARVLAAPRRELVVNPLPALPRTRRRLGIDPEATSPPRPPRLFPCPACGPTVRWVARTDGRSRGRNSGGCPRRYRIPRGIGGVPPSTSPPRSGATGAEAGGAG